LDGEASVKPMMTAAGKQLRFFRFPYNHLGETADKQRTVADFLKQHRYKVAACTIENSDWEFARAYAAMLRKGDSSSARRLRAAYLEYTRQEIDYYSRLDHRIFGREIPEVMLLHANRLNADTLDNVLRIFEKAKYRFVTLDAAQSDPAYTTPDTFFTDAGPMWGYRWAKELNVPVNGRLEPEVPAWISQYK
jgi:hypothetical protein